MRDSWFGGCRIIPLLHRQRHAESPRFDSLKKREAISRKGAKKRKGRKGKLQRPQRKASKAFDVLCVSALLRAFA
jgi:hypothetical protein